MSKGKGAKDVSYGEAAARLEEILRKIEEGKVDIDELSGLVAEAAGLVTLCREKIHAAEVQVKTITEQLERDVEAEAETADDEGKASEDIRY
ncbi:MAG TPA: exodeoxyribonuclease VII small subunit [Candidatus Polarisedimenticolaceae bacterium]|nr:exodeoxyribonuclease VII small subunit [Candidatus Polarisedimenticolaceae bacterium]